METSLRRFDETYSLMLMISSSESFYPLMLLYRMLPPIDQFRYMKSSKDASLEALEYPEIVLLGTDDWGELFLW